MAQNQMTHLKLVRDEPKDDRKFLILIRGLPGSGKTTLATAIQEEGDADMWAADDFFVNDSGEYVFEPWRLAAAHSCCQMNVDASMNAGKPRIIVHNTFTRLWEFVAYDKMAVDHGYRVVIINCYDGGCTDEQLAERNTHGVPLETIKNMRERWEEVQGELTIDQLADLAES